MAFATSAVREAVNGEEVLARHRGRQQVDIQVLSGEDEARLTFLAVRRWFGWSSGRLLVLDIGGGSLEIASGIDEQPDVAVSLPLGAGRLTRDWLQRRPASGRRGAGSCASTSGRRSPARSGTWRGTAGRPRGGDLQDVQAARADRRGGPLARGTVRPPGAQARRPGRMDRSAGQDGARERAALPGVSEGRAPQLPAGAIVADATMDLFEVTRLEVCPWALREGVTSCAAGPAAEQP